MIIEDGEWISISMFCGLTTYQVRVHKKTHVATGMLWFLCFMLLYVDTRLDEHDYKLVADLMSNGRAESAFNIVKLRGSWIRTS